VRRAIAVVLLAACLAACAGRARAPNPGREPSPQSRHAFVEASEKPVLLLVEGAAAPVELWSFDLPAVSDDLAEVAAVEPLPPPEAVVRAGGGPGATLITRRADTGEVLRRATLLSPEETLPSERASDDVRRRVDAANAELGARRWTPLVATPAVETACDAPPRALRVGGHELTLGSNRLQLRDAGGAVVAERTLSDAGWTERRIKTVFADRARRTLLVYVERCGGSSSGVVAFTLRLPT
jgi:hypothetical protein